MARFELPSLDSSPWLVVKADASSIYDVPSLLQMNIAKMHHQQSTAQNIRTWSFAFTGFLLGSSYLFDKRLIVAATTFVITEIVLLVILLREIDWHRMFWKYRDLCRLCEGFLLGNVDPKDFKTSYINAMPWSRSMLLKGCFSPRQIFTATTDFVEVYLMIAVAVAFGVRLVLT